MVGELTRLMALSLGEPIPAYSRREQTSYRYGGQVLFMQVEVLLQKFNFFIVTILQSHLPACG